MSDTTPNQVPFLPFALPQIGEAEIQEVVDSLKSGWITTGPKTKKFEEKLAMYTGAKTVVAVNSCTAGLHVALLALGVGPGDEVITTTMTFAATVNVILHVGAKPVLVDIDRKTGNWDLQQVRNKITNKTKAIMPVHFAGYPCDLDEIYDLAEKRGIAVIEDAAHAIGTLYKGKQIGSRGKAVVFSFYPTKTMTTIEGGAIATDDPELAAKMRIIALHGMSKDAWKRYTSEGSWFYEIVYPGYKYNMTDVQAAVGLHQLDALEGFIERRRHLVKLYRDRLAHVKELELPADSDHIRHSFHLFVVHVQSGAKNRDQVIKELHAKGIGTTVNFIPICNHPFYRERLGLEPENFPLTLDFYKGAISLPLYPKMLDSDVDRVARALKEIFE